MTTLPPLPVPFSKNKPHFTANQVLLYATQARADLEAENKRLREALRDCANQSTGPDWTEKQALDFVKQRARSALKDTKMKLPMFACAVIASIVAGVMAWIGWQAVVTPALIVITVCADEICDALKDKK